MSRHCATAGGLRQSCLHFFVASKMCAFKICLPPSPEQAVGTASAQHCMPCATIDNCRQRWQVCSRAEAVADFMHSSSLSSKGKKLSLSTAREAEWNWAETCSSSSKYCSLLRKASANCSSRSFSTTCSAAIAHQCTSSSTSFWQGLVA